MAKTRKNAEAAIFHDWLKERLPQLDQGVKAPESVKDRIRKSLQDAS